MGKLKLRKFGTVPKRDGAQCIVVSSDGPRATERHVHMASHLGKRIHEAGLAKNHNIIMVADRKDLAISLKMIEREQCDAFVALVLDEDDGMLYMVPGPPGHQIYEQIDKIIGDFQAHVFDVTRSRTN